MDDTEIRDVLNRARTLAEEQPEPYRLATYELLASRLLTTPAVTALPRPQLSESATVAEWLNEYRAQTHPERVMVIAARTAPEPITVRDLVDGYQAARIKRPQNFPDVIASLLRKGWLIEGTLRHEGLKTWVLTGSGERVLAGMAGRAVA